MMCLPDLRCWLHLPRLSLGLSLRQVSPDLHIWSDASEVGWGAHLDCQVASGLWDPKQTALSTTPGNCSLFSWGLSSSGHLSKVAQWLSFATTHSGDLPSQGGWHQVSSPQHLGSGDLALDGVPLHPPGSTVPSGLRHRPSRRPVSPSPAPTYRVVSQMTVFLSLRRLWPVQIDLFATSANHRYSIYFSPFRDPRSAGKDAFLQSWDGLQAYAFPRVAVIPRVLAKLRASKGTELTLVTLHWAQRPWFSTLVQLLLAPPVFLLSRPDLLSLPRSRLLYPDLRRLRLYAWRLSSDLPVPLASPPL